MDGDLTVGNCDHSTVSLLFEVSIIRTEPPVYFGSLISGFKTLGYYSGTLTGMTQKAKSGILKFLWQNDPFKAKWAILAKAYSSIRDRHENAVTLDNFLTLTIPFIGLIEPSKYLQTMGWKVVRGQDFQYHVVKVETVTSDLPSVSTNVSVTDVINYCYASGYVEGSQPVQEPVAGQELPFAAKPAQNPASVDKTTSDDVPQNATLSPRASTAKNSLSSLEGSSEVQNDHPNHTAFMASAQEAMADLEELNNEDELFASFNPGIETFPVFDPISQSDTYDIDLTGF